METLTKPTDTRLRRFTETGTVYPILFMISITHLLNDMMQSVIPAVYPLLKEKFGFTFAQIGIITLVFQMTSSLLQPFIGLYADRHPRPYSLAAGMCFTLVGLLILSVGQKLSKKEKENLNDKLSLMASHASTRERLAIETERETDELKMTEYMLPYVGQEFDGTISGVTSFGMFVQLENGIDIFVAYKQVVS